MTSFLPYKKSSMEHIDISVTNEEGELIFSAKALSVESAIAELGRYERHIKGKIPKNEMTPGMKKMRLHDRFPDVFSEK